MRDSAAAIEAELGRRAAGQARSSSPLVTIAGHATCWSRTITNAGYGEQTAYRAEFTDVTGLVEGDDVRIAGVRVGEVVGIGWPRDRPAGRRGRARGRRATCRCPPSVEATIRYRNLVGQRYVALTEGDGRRRTTARARAASIPLAQTTPALDLTVLFNGFKPLFTALDARGRQPARPSRSSRCFQGEGGTVESLLPTRVADRLPWPTSDAVIGSVIDNLTTVLETRRPRATSSCPDLIVSLQQFVSGLAERPRGDRRLAADASASLAVATTRLLEDARPPLAADIEALGDLAGNLADNGDDDRGASCSSRRPSST